MNFEPRIKRQGLKKTPLCFEPKFCRKFGLTILATKFSCTVEVVCKLRVPCAKHFMIIKHEEGQEETLCKSAKELRREDPTI